MATQWIGVRRGASGGHFSTRRVEPHLIVLRINFDDPERLEFVTLEGPKSFRAWLVFVVFLSVLLGIFVLVGRNVILEGAPQIVVVVLTILTLIFLASFYALGFDAIQTVDSRSRVFSTSYWFHKWCLYTKRYRVFEGDSLTVLDFRDNDGCDWQYISLVRGSRFIHLVAFGKHEADAQQVHQLARKVADKLRVPLG